MGKASQHSPAWLLMAELQLFLLSCHARGASWLQFPLGGHSQDPMVCSPPMDKSLDGPQVPWGWGSLQEGAGLSFGNHQLRLFWLPSSLDLFPKSQLVSAAGDELQGDFEQGQPCTFLSPGSSPSRSLPLGCELKPFNHKPPVVHFLWTSSAFHDFFYFLEQHPSEILGVVGS